DLTLGDDLDGEFGAVAFDGTNFVSTWLRSSTGGTDDLIASRSSRTGTRLDLTPTIVSNLLLWARHDIALSAGPDGRVLSTYVTYDSVADIQTQRVRSRLLSDL